MRALRSIALATLALGPVAACESDSTGPGPQVVITDNISAELTSVAVTHDCDEPTANPGDFLLRIELWQDADPAANTTDYQQIGADSVRFATIHSGQTAQTGRNVEVISTVERVAGRPVSLRVFVAEVDNDVTDEAISVNHTLAWSDSADCWMEDVCIGAPGSGVYQRAWSEEEEFRDDDAGTPDWDEGCHFRANYLGRITDA